MIAPPRNTLCVPARPFVSLDFSALTLAAAVQVPITFSQSGQQVTGLRTNLPHIQDTMQQRY